MLSAADRPYRMFVEHMPDGAATLSCDGVVLYANRALLQLLSCVRDGLVGSSVQQFIAPGGPDVADLLLGRTERATTVELDMLSADGDAIPVRMERAALVLDGQELTCVTVRDMRSVRMQDQVISELRDAHARRMADLEDAQSALIRQATHDALTGLPNRVLLLDRIEQALARSLRTGGNTAVMFVDLDGFKQINDTHGHAAGDTVLRGVAALLVSVLRPMDTVARIGGDEFVVLVPDVQHRFHAAEIGSRLLFELSRANPSDQNDRIEASVGIAVAVAGAGTAEVLLEEADLAMYQAKSLGGGRVEVFDVTLARLVKQRTDARQMLQSALDEQRLVAHYQPIVDVATRTIVGFEALARIIDDDGSIVAPAAFISVAEETGLVVPLGARILGMACAEAVGWDHVSTPTRLNVAVNLSSRQFERGDLVTKVRATLEATGLPPERLHLELTETAVIELRTETLEQLGMIRELGVEVGLDDFGTGYASLTHLRRLPLTFVKIDQSFVQELGTSDEDARIVGAVIDLAANLGLRSIAEGVETGQQFQRLRELGCDQAQGYLFARPQPVHEVASTIRRLA